MNIVTDPNMSTKYGAMRPKDEEGYKKLFWDWIKDLHHKYLAMDTQKAYSNFAEQLFFVKSHQFEEKINPDIAGKMTQSIIDSTQSLKIKEFTESSMTVARNIRKVAQSNIGD